MCGRTTRPWGRDHSNRHYLHEVTYQLFESEEKLIAARETYIHKKAVVPWTAVNLEMCCFCCKNLTVSYNGNQMCVGRRQGVLIDGWSIDNCKMIKKSEYSLKKHIKIDKSKKVGSQCCPGSYKGHVMRVPEDLAMKMKMINS